MQRFLWLSSCVWMVACAPMKENVRLSPTADCQQMGKQTVATVLQVAPEHLYLARPLFVDSNAVQLNGPNISEGLDTPPLTHRALRLLKTAHGECVVGVVNGREPTRYQSLTCECVHSIDE